METDLGFYTRKRKDIRFEGYKNSKNASIIYVSSKKTKIPDSHRLNFLFLWPPLHCHPTLCLLTPVDVDRNEELFWNGGECESHLL